MIPKRWPDPPSGPLLASTAALIAVVSACPGPVGTTTDRASTVGTAAASTHDTAATHDSGGYTGTTTPPGGSGSSGSGGSYAIAGSGAPSAPGLPLLAAPLDEDSP